VVFLWTSCGELCGKDGLRNALSDQLSFLQFFEVYFRQALCGTSVGALSI
jgi:hypothetical protein